MKALTCEMCGSTDIIKQDGVFVCQSCGTKYSVEEAKKMMVEGTVSVKGTVTVDNSGLIDNYLLMAKNAIDAGNHAEAESYCNKIIEINPKHSEAWFLKGKAAGWQSSLAKLRLDESINCFANALQYAPEADNEELKKTIIEETEKLCSAIMQLACNHFAEFPSDDNVSMVNTILQTILLTALPLVINCGGESKDFMVQASEILFGGAIRAYNAAHEEYTHDTHPSEYDWKRFLGAGDNAITLLKFALTTEDVAAEDKIRYYKNMITMQEALARSCSYTYSDGGYVVDYKLTDEAKTLRIDEVMEWHQKIKELNPDYVVPARPSAKSGNGGCYVATAVYGSYDCPEVWTLRRFRDYKLAETWYGRAFIKTYYTISPTLVKRLGDTSWFKRLWRGTLDRFVANLKQQGFIDTPYEDRIW